MVKLLVVLLITTLIEFEVNGAAVNKTVVAETGTEKFGNEAGPFEAIRKGEENTNPKEDSEYMRFQRFQQVLADVPAVVADALKAVGGATENFNKVVINVLLLSGLCVHVVKFLGLFNL